MATSLREKQWEELMLSVQTAVKNNITRFAHMPARLPQAVEPTKIVEAGLVDVCRSRSLSGALDAEFRFAFDFTAEGRTFRRVGYESKATTAMDGSVHGLFIDPLADDQQCVLESVSAGDGVRRWVLAAFDSTGETDTVLARLMHPFQPVRVAALSAIEYLARNGGLTRDISEKATVRIAACLRAGAPDLERRISNENFDVKPVTHEPPAATAAIFIGGVLGAILRGEMPQPAVEPLQNLVFNAVFEAYHGGSAAHADAVVDLEKFRFIIRNRDDLKPRLVLRSLATLRDERVQHFVQANR